MKIILILILVIAILSMIVGTKLGNLVGKSMLDDQLRDFTKNTAKQKINSL